MTYYHQTKPAALEAGQSRFGAEWFVDAQFEPDNGWVIVLQPRNGYTTIQQNDIPDILQHAEIQAVLRTKHEKVRYTPPPKAERSSSGTVGGGSVTHRLKAIFEKVGVESVADRAKFVEAAIADGVNRNSAGAFWAKYTKQIGMR